MQESSNSQDFQLTTAVVFFVFNRPDTTEKVFEKIRQARPHKLFVVADGHRENVIGEYEKCKVVRAVIDKVDWPCEVLKNYSDINLGCKKRVSSGIDWVFEKEEEAIFLEDDCLPHPTFFRYCQELLEKYRHENHVGMISGDNYLFDFTDRKESYYFSRYPHIWGWATWRRAWKNYDVKMELWPKLKHTSFLVDILDNKRSVSYWENIFKAVYEGKINTWDYQWVFACWVQQYLSVTANVNMISNIGFGLNKTHDQLDRFANMKALEMRFPLVHVKEITQDTVKDSYIEKHNFSGTLKWWQLRFVNLKRLFRKN